MTRSALMSIPLLAILAGCTATAADRAAQADRVADDQAKLAHRLGGLVPGERTSCVDQFQLRSASTESFGDTILYRVSSSRIYRNDTSGGCGPGLARGDALISRTPTGQLCRGDILETRDLRVGNITSGSCALGDFVLYTR